MTCTESGASIDRPRSRTSAMTFVLSLAKVALSGLGDARVLEERYLAAITSCLQASLSIYPSPPPCYLRFVRASRATPGPAALIDSGGFPLP